MTKSVVSLRLPFHINKASIYNMLVQMIPKRITNRIEHGVYLC